MQNLADNDDGECHHAISLEIHSLERKAGGRLNEVRIYPFPASLFFKFPVNLQQKCSRIYARFDPQFCVLEGDRSTHAATVTGT